MAPVDQPHHQSLPLRGEEASEQGAISPSPFGARNATRNGYDSLEEDRDLEPNDRTGNSAPHSLLPHQIAKADRTRVSEYEHDPQRTAHHDYDSLEEDNDLNPDAASDSSRNAAARTRVEGAWLPSTLRWPFQVFLLAYTLFLLLMVAVVHAISRRNSGLADDSGSRGIVIASTFVPTLLAVSLVLQISILCDDVKRTEPFARLSAPGGAPAENTLLWTPGPWWSTLIQCFPNKSRHRGMSWMLLFSTLIYVLGSLVVSPFSSTLFVSKDVLLDSQVTLKQLDLGSSLPLQSTLLATTWFRALSGILQNATTSTWIAEEHVGLPFWTADIEEPPVGPILGIEQQTWEAITPIFSAEMPCEAMEVSQISLRNITDDYDVVMPDVLVNLSSPSGCSISQHGYPSTNGYALWTSLLAAPDGVNSTGCTSAQTEFLFFSTPMSTTGSQRGWMLDSAYKAVAYVCQSDYYIGNSTATVHLNDIQTAMTVDKSEFISNRRSIRNEMESGVFEDAFFNATSWTTHLGNLDGAGDGTEYIGPASLLASIYEFSIDKAVSDPDLLHNIRKIKHRFFAETLLENFDTMAQKDPTEVAGTRTMVRRRVVTVPAVAIILEVTLCLQLVMLLTTFRGTRITKRPLNLRADPAPIANLTTLIASDPETLASLRKPEDNEAGKRLDGSLSGLWFHTLNGHIALVPGKGIFRETKNEIAEAKPPIDGDTDTKPQPSVLRLWVVCLLALTLAALLAAIATLYRRSNTVGLYETAFVYGLNVTLGSMSFQDISPASLLTTLVAVGLGMWWQNTEAALRRLQPFLALAGKPIAGFYGTSVSYQSSYLLWSASKAMRRRHWVLGAVSTGAFLMQIFTIAMSALWSKGPGAQSFDLDAARQLVPRRVPYLTTGQFQYTSAAGNYRTQILSSLFQDMKTTWMYTATVQLALNGSEPAWSSDGWSFAPLDLSGVSAVASKRPIQYIGAGTGNSSKSALLDSSLNVTVHTSATRARLECSDYDFRSNPMAWLTEQNVTDSDAWYVDLNPKLIDKGYELGLNAQNATTPMLHIENSTYTTFYVAKWRLSCCDNVTDDQIGTGSVGYWSSDGNQDSFTLWPDLTGSWPVTFTIKWIHGRPLAGFRPVNYSIGNFDMPFSPRLLWAEEPAMTAMGCTPVIETANASVVVRADTGQVLGYDILDAPQPDEYAWTSPFDAYVHANLSSGSRWEENVTVSHGVLFVTALLGAADLSMLETIDSINSQYDTENADERFKIRMPGLNTDFMSYSMLSLADGDHESLLDSKILEATAQKTFSTLYQHFASFKRSATDGNFVYQAFDAELPADIGIPVSESGLSRRDDDILFSRATAPQTTTLHVSQPVELLQMSVPAAWVCMIILACLVVISLTLAYVSRNTGKGVGRRIESIADVAYLTAGSHRLLEMTRNRSPEEMKGDRETRFSLGWFEEENGKAGWKIEVADAGYERKVEPGEQVRRKQESSTEDGTEMEMESLRSHT